MRLLDEINNINFKGLTYADLRTAIADKLETLRRLKETKLLSDITSRDKSDLVRAVGLETLEKLADPASLGVVNEMAKEDQKADIRHLSETVAIVIAKRAQAREKFDQGCQLLWNYKPQDAAAKFSDAIACELGGPYAGLSRGMMLYRRQKYDDALTEFVAVSSDFPWIAETYIYLGQTFTRLGILEPEDNLSFFDSAINSFKKASELGPTLTFPYVGMARTYLKIEGSPQIREDVARRTEAINNAEICVDIVLAEEPDNPHGLLAKSQLLEKKAASANGDSEKEKLLAEAESIVNRIISMENVEPNNLVFAYGSKAKRCVDSENYKEAAVYCRKAMEIAGIETDKAIFRWLQDSLKNTGDVPGAVQTCKEWINLYPDDAWGYANLGNLLKKSDPDESLRNLGRAYEMGKSIEGIRKFVSERLARTLFSQRKPFEAREILKNAPDETLRHQKSIDLLRAIDYEIERRRRASDRLCNELEQELKAADRRSPDFLDMIKRFCAKVQNATIEDPYNPRLWSNLARLENEMKNFVDAIKHCDRALELLESRDDFTAAVIHFNYGIALKGVNSVDGAIDHFKIAAAQSKGGFKVMAETEVKRLESRKAVADKGGKQGEFITYKNNVTGFIEKHYIKDLQDFVSVLSSSLPIGGTLPQIGHEPVFLRAATGVGKTVTTPMHLFMIMWNTMGKKGGKIPQVLVVEPRIPIAIDEMRHMNETYQEFIKQKDGVGIISRYVSLTQKEQFASMRKIFSEEYKDMNMFKETVFAEIPDLRKQAADIQSRIGKELHLVYMQTRDLHGDSGPFGVITSLGAVNPEAPVVFVTTGVFEKRAFEDDLDPNSHRILVDEGHITLERNPGVEIAVSLCRRKGISVDYMSATVDKGTLEEDLGVKLIDCGKEQFPIEYRIVNGRMTDVIEAIVDTCLIRRLDISEDLRNWDKKEPPDKRAVGLLIVVNSHMSENSDTLKFQNKIRSNPNFKGVEVLRLASPVIRDPMQRRDFLERVKSIEKRCGRYVIIATNVVEMGITFPSLDFIVTMDTEYVNVERTSGTTLEIAELSLNALKQRAGRVGRKRPGICYITKEYKDGKGAWYTNLPGSQLKSLSPEKIKYPLETADLNKLAFLSFKESVSDENLREWVRSLNLPSRIHKDSHRMDNLQSCRLLLKERGIADQDGITSLGNEILKYVGVEDIDFARMSALCNKIDCKSVREYNEIRQIMITLAALSEISLGEMLQQSASLKIKDDEGRKDCLSRLILSEKVGPVGGDISPDNLVAIMGQCDTVDEMRRKLLDINLTPHYVSQLVSLAIDGFLPRTALEVVGEEPNRGDFSNDADFNLAYESWKIALETNKNYVHMQKNAVTLDCDSELLAMYDIICYFFNKYQQLFFDDLPLYERQILEASFANEAEGLELKRHIVKAAMDRVVDLFDYLDEPMPIFKRECPEEMKPANRDLRRLFESFAISESITHGISAPFLVQLARAVYDSSDASQPIKTRHMDKLASEFRTSKSNLEMLFKIVITPAWEKYRQEWKRLNYVEYRHFLPRLRDELRSKVLEHIKSCKYGSIIELERGSLAYVGKINFDGCLVHVELNNDRTPLHIQEENIRVMAKVSPGVRPDGIEVLSVTHATLLH